MVKITKMHHRAVETARNILSCGCIEQDAYIQFGSDIPVYGLKEALMLAQNYEDRGAYVQGTVQKAQHKVAKWL